VQYLAKDGFDLLWKGFTLGERKIHVYNMCVYEKYRRLGCEAV
jgi:hypothetical protein